MSWRVRCGGGATALFAHRRKFISGMKNAPSSRPSPPFKMAIYLISCGMTVSRRDFSVEIPVLGLGSIGRRTRYGRRRKFRSNLDGSPPPPPYNSSLSGGIPYTNNPLKHPFDFPMYALALPCSATAWRVVQRTAVPYTPPPPSTTSNFPNLFAAKFRVCKQSLLTEVARWAEKIPQLFTIPCKLKLGIRSCTY